MNEAINKADQLLSSVQKAEIKKTQAKLRVFFGMSAGVGKTYAMLKAAHRAKNEGKDIVIGFAESHGRIETSQLFKGLEFIPLKKIHYRDKEFEELDLDAILARKPEIVVIDELAHSNIPGSRHNKRYQDLLEILDAGISVYTAVNVQHIESRKDSVEKITGITIQETVPDSIIERADLIELIDISPSELLQRLREGKVYLGDKAVNAQQNFFKEAPLSALRETSLRLVAERVDRDVQEMTQIGEIQGPLNTNERLMVAISHSPYSEKLIRSARRIAYNLEAPWIAVNVDTGLKLSDKDELQRNKNIELAIELGAKVITITDTNLAQALSTIARQYNVSQIMVGRPSKKSIKDFFEGGSFLDQLIKEAKDIDIHLIKQEDNYKAIKSFSWTGFNSPFIHYCYSFILVSLITLIGYFIQNFIGYHAVGFIFLLGVLAISLIFNLGPILFTALTSALSWDLLFIPPFGTLDISAPEDIMMCTAFFIAAASTGILTSRIRKQKKILKDRGEKNQLLYEISRCLVSERNLTIALTIVLQELEKSFKGKFFIIRASNGSLDLDSTIGSTQLINDHELGVAKWVYEKGNSAGWSTDTLPASKGLYIPLKSSQFKVGVLAYMPENKVLYREQSDLLHIISREIALVLERDIFEKKAKEVEQLEACDKLHQALLSSISHEIKTPLTTIIGTATTIIDLKENSDSKLMKDLLDELLGSAEKLKYIVENLLDMTRIQSESLVLKKEWYDISDIINSIINKNTRLLKNFSVNYKFQEDLPLIFVDYKLLEQALANIILNAAHYSVPGTIITITIISNTDNLIISINDQGPGISEHERTKIFDKFYRISGSTNNGTGLGLYISKEILDLHSASIQVKDGENNKGTKFIITLPLTHG